MKKVNRISVIGSGGWGTAIARLLKNNGHDVTLWSWLSEESRAIEENKENKEFLRGIKLPDGIHYTSDLKLASENAEVIVLVTPSHVLRSTVETISKYIDENVIIVNLTKGFEKETLKTFSGVIKSVCPKNPVAVLSGPSHAEEVGKDLPTTVVAAAVDIHLAEKVQDIFMSDNFRVYTNTDVTGVEVGGAIKNVIALCCGVLDGMGFGDNTKAALMTRGLAEITRLGVSMGAKPATFAGLAGVGDLIVTCTSAHSRNNRAGRLIGEGMSPADAIEKVHSVVEGFYATECTWLLAKKNNISMPITEAAYGILFEGQSVSDAIKNLMTREPKSEHEF